MKALVCNASRAASLYLPDKLNWQRCVPQIQLTRDEHLSDTFSLGPFCGAPFPNYPQQRAERHSLQEALQKQFERSRKSWDTIFTVIYWRVYILYKLIYLDTGLYSFIFTLKD